jgi:hypothetical protein
MDACPYSEFYFFMYLLRFRGTKIKMYLACEFATFVQITNGNLCSPININAPVDSISQAWLNATIPRKKEKTITGNKS